jgi:hypothetical protein
MSSSSGTGNKLGFFPLAFGFVWITAFVTYRSAIGTGILVFFHMHFVISPYFRGCMVHRYPGRTGHTNAGWQGAHRGPASAILVEIHLLCRVIINIRRGIIIKTELLGKTRYSDPGNEYQQKQYFFHNTFSYQPSIIVPGKQKSLLPGAEGIKVYQAFDGFKFFFSSERTPLAFQRIG